MSLRFNPTNQLIELAVSLAVAIGATARADIINVPGDFLTIQEAIDAAVDTDEIVVAPGTYFESINFLGKAIWLRSSDGPDLTTIDGTGNFHVVQCVSGEGSDTVLDGFVITGGNADGDELPDRRGGGMFNENSSPTVTNCKFSGNAANVAGGGMFNFLSNPTVTNCTFTGNSGNHGGGMYNDFSDPNVTNCSFIGNSAHFGGGMLNNHSSPNVTNCTFSGNTATGNGGGIFSANNSTSFMIVTNCILWGNMPDQIHNNDFDFCCPVVGFSDVQGGLPFNTIDGGGNIDADPLFVDPDNGDYRLSSGSPAIDAGHNWHVPVDENDYDKDGNLCELFPVDLDGNPRFNADELDFDPGCGVPVVVDMGAYEYQFDPVDQVTFADLNADNAVGVADLLALLASWGPCGKGCCLADLDIDGNVGISDLLALLANWGPCP